MHSNFSFAKWKLADGAIKEPRVLMRALIGVLLVANLAAALIAFAPFGVSPEGLRQEHAALVQQLTEMQRRNAANTRLVANVDTARREGGQFLEKYIVDRRTVASGIYGELNRMAETAGMVLHPTNDNLEPIEGSDALQMLTITASYEGTYAGLKKLIDLLDKSQRFLIVEKMDVQTPQTQQQATQRVIVSMKVDTFVRGTSGAAL